MNERTLTDASNASATFASADVLFFSFFFSLKIQNRSRGQRRLAPRPKVRKLQKKNPSFILTADSNRNVLTCDHCNTFTQLAIYSTIVRNIRASKWPPADTRPSLITRLPRNPRVCVYIVGSRFKCSACGRHSARPRHQSIVRLSHKPPRAAAIDVGRGPVVRQSIRGHSVLFYFVLFY